MTLSLERLCEVLEYLPDEGLFIWQRRMGTRAAKGQLAGCLHPRGNIEIRIDGRSYKAHRLAWLYMTGAWPRHEIDHINLKPADNRWRNLREATHSQNQMNQGLGANNTSGFKGVSKSGNRWRARIMINNKYYCLGSFDNIEDARRRYEQEAKLVHGTFARFN